MGYGDLSGVDGDGGEGREGGDGGGEWVGCEYSFLFL